MEQKEWYLAETETIIKSCLVERVIDSYTAPDLIEIYGTEVLSNGSASEIKLLDIADKEDRSIVRPKCWLKKICIVDTYFEYGKWFSRKFVVRLAITMILNESTGMWERLEF